MSKLPDASEAVRKLNPHLYGAQLSAYGQPTPGKADYALERELQKLCERELSRRNIWYLHLSPHAREKAGTPDIIAAVNGIAFAVEVKTPTGKLSEDQKNTLELMAANGWRTFVVRSYEEFTKALRMCNAAAHLRAAKENANE